MNELTWFHPDSSKVNAHMIYRFEALQFTEVLLKLKLKLICGAIKGFLSMWISWDY